MNNTVEDFFEEFEEASNNFNAKKSAEQFADVFLHSDPESERTITNDDFVKSLPARKAFFDTLGLQSTSIKVDDKVELSDDYVLVKTDVDMKFNKDGKMINLHQTASYLLKRKKERFVIITYINDQLLNKL